MRGAIREPLNGHVLARLAGRLVSALLAAFNEPLAPPVFFEKANRIPYVATLYARILRIVRRGLHTEPLVFLIQLIEPLLCLHFPEAPAVALRVDLPEQGEEGWKRRFAHTGYAFFSLASISSNVALSFPLSAFVMSSRIRISLEI